MNRRYLRGLGILLILAAAVASGWLAGIGPRLVRAQDKAQVQAQEQAKAQLKQILQAQVQLKGRAARLQKEDGEAGLPPQLVFATDRATVQRLAKAQDALNDKNYKDAVRHLQIVLDHPEDFFFRPDETRQSHFVGVKAETQRIISEMPPEGREAYELLYGAEAKVLLDDGIAGDASKLSEAVRRFFHTEAGYTATELLGSIYADQDQPLAAAICYERLRRIPQQAAAREPLLSLKTAVCWQRAGMPEQTTRVLAELKSTPGGWQGAIPPEALAELDHPPSWLQKLAGQSAENPTLAAVDWPIYRGTASRSAVSRGGTPFLKSQWRHTSTQWRSRPVQLQAAEEEVDVTAPLNEVYQQFVEAGLPLMPAAHPLVVGNRIIVRTYNHLKWLDLESGAEVKRSVDPDFLMEQLQQDQNIQSPVARADGGQLAPIQLLLRQRAWEDATWGTLSSDGRYVFCLEDLGFWGPFGFNPGNPHPLAPKDYNRLTAYDLQTGKLVWELGGPVEEKALPLAGTFFLGPPLPLGQELICLAEVAGEIRVMALSAADRGRVLWSQTLAQTEQNVMVDQHRRQSGLSPSAADGVLICPTGAGAIVALDMTTRSLLWAYRYTDPVPTDPRQRQQMMILRQQRMNGSMQSGLPELDRWYDALATIEDARVIITPRDSEEIHCLNLVDGSLVWHRPRGQGMYVGDVHQGKVIVVGSRQVEALKLTDGTPVWTTPTPLPSGRGFTADDLYHVPLATAEVATIDLKSGRILNRSKSRDGRPPGNLVSAGRVVVSQSHDGVSGFRPLNVLEEEITRGLAANPEDPAILSLRGEIRLNQGKLELAYADLRQSLSLRPDAPETRAVLFESLLEGLRTDFATSRLSIDEIERLIDQPEQRGAFLRTLAAGLQAAGESRAAYDVYLRLAGPDVGDPPLERIDSTIAVRRDRWVKAQLTDLYAHADEPARTAMDEEIAGRLELARTAMTPESLQAFLNHFGNHSQADEARRLLVDLHAAEGYTLETERRLRVLQRASDPAVSGFATARLVELLIQAGRPADATSLLELLATRYAETVCLNDKTGKELAETWRAGPEIGSLATSAGSFPVGTVAIDKKPGNRTNNFMFRLPLEGDQGPFFRDTQISMDQRQQGIVATDGWGREIWKVSLQGSGAFFNPYGSQGRVRDHLVILGMGSQVIAVDPIGTPNDRNPRILWREDLVDTLPGAPKNQGVNIQQVMVPGGGFKFVATDPFGNPLGTVGAARDDSLCLQRGRKLTALEPFTGKPLWQRFDATPGSELFGDDELLFVVAPNATEATVIRMLDGKLLDKRAIPPAATRLTQFDRYILVWNQGGDGQRLSLFDVWEQRDVWTTPFAAGAKVSLIEQDEVGIVEPTKEKEGKFSLIRVSDGSRIIDSAAVPVGSLSQVLVVRSEDHYVLFTGIITQMQAANRVWSFGYNNPVIDGQAHGFDRKTGQYLWTQGVDKQGLDLGQARNLPILVFASRVQEQVPLPNGQITYKWDYQLQCLDKRTGKTVLDEREPGSMNTLDLNVFPNENRIAINVPGQTPALYELTFKPVEKKE